MLADYEALVREGAVYVLSEGNDVAGVLVIRPVGEAMFVENVAVHPAYEKAGRGRALMRFAEKAARESGRRELVLYTNELMTENIDFYEGLGYRGIERRLDGGYRRVFMCKKVPEEA